MTVALIIIMCLIYNKVYITHGSETTYFSDNIIKEGLMFPRNVKVFVGDDVVLKLQKSIDNQEKCTYRRPASNQDIEVPADMR